MGKSWVQRMHTSCFLCRAAGKKAAAAKEAAGVGKKVTSSCSAA
jgi:hypothetical protein